MPRTHYLAVLGALAATMAFPPGRQAAPAWSVQQQAPPRDAATNPAIFAEGTAQLSGIVVDALTNQPIRRVTVNAAEQGSTATRRIAVTGDDGRFTFRQLPAGRYLVTALKAAFLPTAYGVRTPLMSGAIPTGSALALAEGQSVTDTVIRMMRGAVVTGTVRDSEGRPVRGAAINLAYRLRAPLTGDPTMALVANGGATTDIRGAYRIFGVPPGAYIVRARPGGLAPVPTLTANDFEVTTSQDLERLANRPGAATTSSEKRRRPTYGYAAVYHPGTTALSAAVPITLAPAEERAGVDFQIVLTPQSRLSGRITGPDDVPVPGMMVRLSDRTPYASGPFLTWLTANSDPQGRYEIRAIAPGDYVVEVRPFPGATAGAKTWARADVTITSNDDAQLDLALQPGLTVSGQLTVERTAAAPGPELTRARVALMNRDGIQTAAVVDSEGRFSVTGLSPDAYRWSISVASTDPWFAKSATLMGRDALDDFIALTEGQTGASIVLTSHVSEISGAIQDGAGRPAPEYFLVVYPSDRTLWTWASRRIAQTRPASDGQFAFRNLPPGDYLLGAVTDLDASQIYDPAFLGELLGASVAVKLGEGEKKRQDLKVR